MKPCLLLALASCLVVRGLSGVATAQDAGEPSFTLTELAPRVWAAISNPKSRTPAPANTGFVIGDDGVAVIDTSMSVDANGTLGIETARQVLATIRGITRLPVRFVINTHHHMDHVGGNAVFVDAGATVLAHSNVRRWIHGEHLRLLGQDAKPQIRAFMEALVPPTVTYDRSVDLHLGSRTIRVQSFPGHTGGDSVVLVPDAQVVFAGDLLWRDIVPTLDDASTTPWVDTLDTLVRNEPGATFVPGHGQVGTAKDVVALREFLVTLRTLVSDARARGQSGEALADAVVPQLSGRYGRWEGFEFAARPSVLQTDAELSGTKRIPKADPVR